jgi:hypothetical protein
MSTLDAMLGQPLCRRIRPADAAHVEQVLRSCLAPGVPPSWHSIDGARYVSAQPRHEATAELTMFDGLPAKVRVWFYASGSDACAHEWTYMPGGHCSFEDGRWVRIDPETLEPFPEQRDMFATLAQQEPKNG